MTAAQNLNHPSLSEMIEERRLQLGLTKSQAARLAGVSRGTWHEVESGKRTNMLADTLNLFDKALGYERGHLRKATRGGIELDESDAVGPQHVVDFKDHAGRRLGENELRMQLVRYAATARSDELAQVVLFISHTSGGEWSWLRAELQPRAADDEPVVPDDRGTGHARQQGDRPSRDGSASPGEHIAT